MASWHAYESYTGPLGAQTLTDILGSHYGPGIESSERNGWGQWHRADHEGIGMDRSMATGPGSSRNTLLLFSVCMSQKKLLPTIYSYFSITCRTPTCCIRARP